MGDNKTNWWVIIAVVVVVAIVASLVTISLTGDVISVAKGTYGKVYTTSEVYSKAEVDAKFNNLSYASNQILNKLNKLVLASQYSNNFFGDVNDDGIIDVADLQTITNYLNNQSVFKINKMKADVNLDGKVDIADRQLIYAHLNSGYPNLPQIY